MNQTQMRETRSYRAVGTPEMRSTDDGQTTLTAYAAVFNRLSQNLGGFVEEVDPGAFTDTLRNDRNVFGSFNHDLSQLLATTDSDTLDLGVDVTGLRYEMSLDVEDPDAVRVIRKVHTGKVRGSSFSFATRDDAWSTTEDGFPLRRLLAVELFELGPVTSPAYRSTEEEGAAVALRSFSQFVDLPFEQVTEAARTGQLNALILRDLGREDEADDEGSRDTHPSTSERPGRRIPAMTR